MNISLRTSVNSWVKFDPTKRSVWQASTVWLAGLGLVVGLCLTARFAVQAVSLLDLAAQASLGSGAPGADGAASDDSVGDGILPAPWFATSPRLLTFSVLPPALFPLPAAPQPIPHPPQ